MDIPSVPAATSVAAPSRPGPRATIRAAAIPYIARHPRYSPTRPLTVRAARMPMSRPLMTVPTTRPRSEGSARWAANGTSNCGVIEVTPTTRLAAASQAKLGAAATPSRATAAAPSIARMNDPPLQSVAQGDEKEQAGGVADLREHGDQPHAAVGDAEVAAHVGQERLA